jgi:acetate kinase
MVGLDIADSKIVTCHIGNGSSITATVNGRSIDTSMGLTPLEGLIMGTRCGDVDANAILYLMRKEDMTVDQMYRLVNKESGFLGLSEKTSDAREMDELANAGDPKAKLVFKMLTFQMIKYIGAYAAAMNGLDAVFFTGGIGEHNSRLRRRVCENFSYLGLKLDYEANTASGVDTVISLPDSQVRVALVTTDEELVIARDTMQIVQNLNE